MTTTVSIRFKFRRDTAANWTSANPVLLQGEPGLETDTGKLKFGDGTTAWNSLAYFSPPATIGTGDVTTAKIADSAVTLAKMADVATATVFYRKTAGTGAPEVQTLATLKTDLGLAGTNSGDALVAYMALQSAYALANSTAVQKLFNVGASSGGEITLATGIYAFECFLQITAMSAVSGNGQFSLAGTAALARQIIHVVGTDNTTTANPAAQNGTFTVAASATTTNMTSGGTGTALGVRISGVIDVTTAGTIIPSVALQTAAAAIVSAGSFFQISRIGNTATDYAGAVA